MLFHIWFIIRIYVCISAVALHMLVIIFTFKEELLRSLPNSTRHGSGFIRVSDVMMSVVSIVPLALTIMLFITNF